MSDVATSSLPGNDGRTAAILRSAEITPRARAGGARTLPMVSARVGARDFLNGITMFPPGTAIAEHFHNCDESVLILRGHAVAHVAGERHPVAAGDVSFIPAGVHHFFENTSATDELHIFWTYASLDADRTIVSTGVTTRIDQELDL
jgi:putative monooxygenase